MAGQKESLKEVANSTRGNLGEWLKLRVLVEERNVDGVLEQMSKIIARRDPVLKTSAVRLLAEMDDPKVQEKLVEMVNADSALARAVVNALAVRGSVATITKILPQVLSLEDTYISTALKALSEGGPLGAAVLEGVCMTTDNPNVFEPAIRALGANRSQEATRALINVWMAVDDIYWNMRENHTYSSISDHMLQPLRDVLVRRDDPLILETAKRVCLYYGSERIQELGQYILSERRALRELKEITLSELADSDTREWAVETLNQLAVEVFGTEEWLRYVFDGEVWKNIELLLNELKRGENPFADLLSELVNLAGLDACQVVVENADVDKAAELLGPAVKKADDRKRVLMVNTLKRDDKGIEVLRKLGLTS